MRFAAVLPLADEPRRAEATLTDVEDFAGEERFASLVEAVQRIRRLIKDADPDGDPSLLTAPVEQELVTAVEALQATLPGSTVTVSELVSASSGMVGALEGFLDEVLVMDEDLKIRDARIALLATVTRIAGRAGVDWDAMSRFVATQRQPVDAMA